MAHSSPLLDASLKTGARPSFALPEGSGDALLLARLARQRVENKLGMLAIVCADPHDAERLKDEIKWFAPELRAHVLPDWETLPYDAISPHQDLVSERLETLYLIARGEVDVLLVAASTALQRLAPAQYIVARTFFIKVGDKLDEAALRAQFHMAGYTHMQQVVSPGEWTARGSLIDLFPMGSAVPYRIDLFGADIESIKTFDVDTQRSIYPVREIRLLPGREFPLDEEARTAFRGRFREVFEGDPSRFAMYKDMANGVATAGIEYYLPLFYEQTETLFDYLPASALLMTHGRVDEAFTAFWKEIEERYRFLKADTIRPLFAPHAIYLDGQSFFVESAAFAAATLKAAAPAADAPPRLPSVAVNRRADDPVAALRHFIDAFAGRVLLAADSAGRRETMLEYLRNAGVEPVPCESFADFLTAATRLMITAHPLGRGFIDSEAGQSFAVITEAELYAETTRARTRREKKRETNVDGMLKDLSELKVGDPVVHAQHGIGRYLGLVNMTWATASPSFCICSTPTTQNCMCRWRRSPSSAATRAPVKTRRRCTASAAASGKKPNARRRCRYATPLPSCSTFTRAALRARATPSVSKNTITTPSLKDLVLKKPAIRPQRSAMSSKTCARAGRWTA